MFTLTMTRPKDNLVRPGAMHDPVPIDGQRMVAIMPAWCVVQYYQRGEWEVVGDPRHIHYAARAGYERIVDDMHEHQTALATALVCITTLRNRTGQLGFGGYVEDVATVVDEPPDAKGHSGYPPTVVLALRAAGLSLKVDRATERSLGIDE